MSALGKALNWLGIHNSYYPDDLPPITSAQAAAGSDFYRLVSGQAGGLKKPTAETAMTISAVYACVNLIAGAIASLPMHIYTRNADGERDRAMNDDLWWVLNEQFCPQFAAASGWEYLVQSLLLRGDGFALILRKGGRITGIEPLHPDRVMVAYEPVQKRLVYAVHPSPLEKDGKIIVIDQDDMLHFPGFGFDGLRGMTPLKHHLSMTGAVALATQEYAGRFFANSARPDVILTTDQDITQETADAIRDAWQQRYSGPENAGRPAVLGRGTKAEPLTMSMEDAQLIPARQFQIEEVARAFGVPPFMIGHTEKTTSWGSGVEAMGTGFVRYTLRPHLNKFHNEINRKFFRTAGRFAEFDTTELERADTKSMFEAFRIAIGRAGEPGFMTQDEVRARLNLKSKGNDMLSLGVQDAQTVEPAPQ